MRELKKEESIPYLLVECRCCKRVNLLFDYLSLNSPPDLLESPRNPTAEMVVKEVAAAKSVR